MEVMDAEQNPPCGYSLIKEAFPCKLSGCEGTASCQDDHEEPLVIMLTPKDWATCSDCGIDN
jgi:hypothetical protein